MEKEIEQKFDELLTAVKAGFDGVSEEMSGVKEDVKTLKEDLKITKDDVKILKSTVVTKDYLDDKLSDLGAEIGKRINRTNEEQRLFAKTLIKFLSEDKVLKDEHIHQLEEMLA